MVRGASPRKLAAPAALPMCARVIGTSESQGASDKLPRIAWGWRPLLGVITSIYARNRRGNRGNRKKNQKIASREEEKDRAGEAKVSASCKCPHKKERS